MNWASPRAGLQGRTLHLSRAPGQRARGGRVGENYPAGMCANRARVTDALSFSTTGLTHPTQNPEHIFVDGQPQTRGLASPPKIRP